MRTNDQAEGGRGWPAVAAAMGLSVMGVLVVLLTTPLGIGTSVDSAAYIRAARALASGSGDASLVQHAPLYSFLLALGVVIGLDPMSGARWLNALTFGANIFLVGFLARRCATHLRWVWVIGSTSMLVLVPMVTAHVTALSEPVFLTCMLTGFWLLSRYTESPTLGRLLMSAVVIGMALLARYAGAACILSGAIAIVATGSNALRLRVRDAVLFGTVAALPMLAWMARNMFVTSTTTGRELSFHPAGLSHAWQALYTMSGWLLISQSAPDVVRFVTWLAIGALAAIVVVRSARTSTVIPALVRVLALFVVTYGAFLASSISFLDANTPLDDRILLPVLAVSLVLVSYALDVLWPVARRVPALSYASVALMALLTGGHGLKAAEAAATGYENGWGFSSVAWRQSRTLSLVAQFESGVPIFSNAPEIVYLRTGRAARGIPRTRFLMNDQPNREYATQLANLERGVRDSCGVVIYLRNLAQQAMPSEAELRNRLSLDVLTDVDDGVIWGVKTCPP